MTQTASISSANKKKFMKRAFKGIVSRADDGKKYVPQSPVKTPEIPCKE